jgi:heavy metal sensor kinase
MRLRPLSIRSRLTLSYTAALAVLLAVYAAGVFLFFRDGLHTQLDRQLYDDVERAEDMLTWSSGGSLTWRMSAHEEDDVSMARWLEVWSLDRRLLYRSAAAERQPMASLGPATEQQGTSTVRASSGAFRVQAQRAFVEGQPVLMRVARSEEQAHAELARIAWILGLGLPLGALCAAAAGYSLARRALAPVDRLATRASAITAERLGERLPVETPDDELGRLARAFNSTLARLEQSFDQMRRFTSDASHELRTPLTAIRSVGEVGLQQARSTETYREIIGSMLEEVDRLSQLVESLLTLSRADAGHLKLTRQTVELASLVRDTIAQLLVLAEEKDQSISTTLSRPAPVQGDPVLLRRAIVNLLDNAIKFGPPGTQIRVTLTTDDGQIALSIKDEGPGIAEADQPHVFDRFFRADRARSRNAEGVGLGLAIARWVVEAHGGSIGLESQEGHGCTFRITLPSYRSTGTQRVSPTDEVQSS